MGTSFDTAQSLEVERDLSSTTWLMLACAAFVLLGIWFVASPRWVRWRRVESSRARVVRRCVSIRGD